MKQALKDIGINLLKNWKTTFLGLSTIVTTCLTVEDNKGKILGIITGLGIMVAKDGNVTGTAKNPRADESIVNKIKDNFSK